MLAVAVARFAPPELLEQAALVAALMEPLRLITLLLVRLTPEAVVAGCLGTRATLVLAAPASSSLSTPYPYRLS